MLRFESFLSPWCCQFVCKGMEPARPAARPHNTPPCPQGCSELPSCSWSFETLLQRQTHAVALKLAIHSWDCVWYRVGLRSPHPAYVYSSMPFT